MKYRIKQIGYQYYPQQRWLLFFWRSYILDNGDVLSYNSLESAQAFLRVNHVETEIRDKVVIHPFEVWK